MISRVLIFLIVLSTVTGVDVRSKKSTLVENMNEFFSNTIIAESYNRIKDEEVPFGISGEICINDDFCDNCPIIKQVEVGSVFSIYGENLDKMMEKVEYEDIKDLIIKMNGGILTKPVVRLDKLGRNYFHLENKKSGKNSKMIVDVIKNDYLGSVVIPRRVKKSEFSKPIDIVKGNSNYESFIDEMIFTYEGFVVEPFDKLHVKAGDIIGVYYKNEANCVLID